MTYNIHRWVGGDQRMDLDRLASVITAAGADLVGLNEVLHPVTTPHHTHAPLAELADRLGMRYALRTERLDRPGARVARPVGNAILSRYPLADVSNVLLPACPARSSARSWPPRWPGPVAGLTTFVTHLDHAL